MNMPSVFFPVTGSKDIGIKRHTKYSLNVENMTPTTSCPDRFLILLAIMRCLFTVIPEL